MSEKSNVYVFFVRKGEVRLLLNPKKKSKRKLKKRGFRVYSKTENDEMVSQMVQGIVEGNLLEEDTEWTK